VSARLTVGASAFDIVPSTQLITVPNHSSHRRGFEAKVPMKRSSGIRTFRILELALYHSLGKLLELALSHDLF
jgi:hypothetical protein